MTEPLRIAVRKFAPFESAMQKIWDLYCLSTGCMVPVELVPMELPLLHQSLLEDDGLKNGDWDVAHLNTDWIYEACSAGALENLAGRLSAKDMQQTWSDSLLGLQNFNSGVYGLPFHDGPECLIYRKDLFEDPAEQRAFLSRYGKTLAPPKTWDEFVTLTHFFQRPEANLYGTVFAGYPDGHNTVFDFCLQLWTRGGSLLDENGGINIDTPEALAALEFYRNIMNDEEAVHPGSKTYESVQSGAAFARGEVAMMVNWFGFASVCEVDEQSKVKGKVDVCPVPEGSAGQSCSLNVYWLYTIGSGSKKKDLATDFIKFATNAVNDKLLTLEGGIGCRKSTWLDPEVNVLVPYYHKLEELHAHAKTLPQRKNWSQIAVVLDALVTEAVNTDQPINRLLKLAQENILYAERVYEYGA